METLFTEAQTPRDSVRTCQGLTLHTQCGPRQELWTWPQPELINAVPLFGKVFQGQALVSSQTKESEIPGLYGIAERVFLFCWVWEDVNLGRKGAPRDDEGKKANAPGDSVYSPGSSYS